MEITEKLKRFAEVYETPFLVLDMEQIERNYRRLQQAVPRSVIYYAVKANSHAAILKTLDRLGSCFDVASRGEIEKLLSLGISPERMSFGNTIKKEPDIAFAYEMGIPYYAVDCEMEVEKIARNAPGAKVYGRIQMSSVDSDWPLSKKFGTDIDHVQSILVLAKQLGLEPYGVTFHVGSQTYNKYRWKEAIVEVSEIFYSLKENHGIELKLVNLGGGIPIAHVRPIPSVEEIGTIVSEAIDNLLGDVEGLQVFIEPGRSMAGDAGTLVSRVLLRSRKQTEEWLYIDAGVFHGLMETIENFRYEIIVPGREYEETKIFTLAGPTCDSVDMVYEEVELPQGTTYQDVLYFKNTGAYTAEYGTHFNGIHPPKVYLLDDIPEE
ncbi:MAG TPA: type III PLP-dependent enzyme [Thermotogota bacterium]|nr:type III PLP-dependent enzyme [Thermotogota bacterium]HRW91436.1 type III PLP-dependent enzyme [Thermotogota bacterium]